MKSRPRIGETAEVQFVAEDKHAIDFATEGMPSVLSTPWLIWFMEHSARKAMLPYLEPTESTVGMTVDIDHLAATPTGNKVTCKAQVLRTEENKFHFKIEAFDEHEKVASGLHKLAVVDKVRLANRVKRKQKKI